MQNTFTYYLQLETSFLQILNIEKEIDTVYNEFDHNIHQILNRWTEEWVFPQESTQESFAIFETHSPGKDKPLHGRRKQSGEEYNWKLGSESLWYLSFYFLIIGLICKIIMILHVYMN